MKKNAHLYTTEDEAIQSFLNQIEKEDINPYFSEAFESDEMDTIDEIYDLLEQLEFEPNRSKKRKICDKILALDPDNIDAQIMLLSQENIIDFLQGLKKLEESEKQKWLKTNQAGWIYFEERPYLRMKYILGQEYLKQFMVKKAKECFEELYFQLDKNDHQGARYELMYIYCLLSDWEKASNLFYSQSYFKNDDMMIFPLLVMAILEDRQSEAQELLTLLSKANRDVKHMVTFSDDFSEALADLELFNFDTYIPNSIQSLAILYDKYAMRVFSIDDYVLEWIEKHFSKRSSIKPLTLLEKKTVDESIFSDLSANVARQFIEKKLFTKKDFQKVTEKELLELKGVGAKTIEKLKSKGIVLKK
ncbi:hypothetical protein GMA11_02335 [Granulicatella sp. zg-ZJ]|uniref:tetratricopeptide repeat protein n=1 Tax=Granulicatella sp. zg-ZJ TaxID=2678504 RepID=UPI0013D22192|nr:hypothetical protein [Granulicatella sp. zg-ZJ]NEW62225.1 hypothetical protein [Granulicatella sp. zg-ZJ]